MRSSFVIVGDVMVDTVAQIDGAMSIGSDHVAAISRHVGGQAANTAAWLGWMNSSVTLIAACGSDPEAQWIQEKLESYGVRTSFHATAEPTGRCVVVVGSNGSRTMFSEAGANNHLTKIPREIWSADIEAVDPPTHVHLSGYLLARDPDLLGTVLTAARSLSPEITTSMDTAALIPTSEHRKALRDALPFIDVVMGTREELSGLANDPDATRSISALVDHWRDALGFAGVVVVKEGAGGATAGQQGSAVHVPALSANVVDTTGAGDAFAAGFLAAWTLGRDDLAAALLAGHQAASVAITQIGAGPPPADGR